MCTRSLYVAEQFVSFFFIQLLFLFFRHFSMRSFRTRPSPKIQLLESLSVICLNVSLQNEYVRKYWLLFSNEKATDKTLSYVLISIWIFAFFGERFCTPLKLPFWLSVYLNCFCLTIDISLCVHWYQIYEIFVCKLWLLEAFYISIIYFQWRN